MNDFQVEEVLLNLLSCMGSMFESFNSGELDDMGLLDMVEELDGVQVNSLSESGYMTNDRGVELTFPNGQTFLLTIKQR